MTRTTQDTDGRPLAVITPTETPGVELYQPTRWHGDRPMTQEQKTQNPAIPDAAVEASAKSYADLVDEGSWDNDVTMYRDNWRELCRDFARTVLTAALPHLIPPGHVVVPVEPTPQMVRAAIERGETEPDVYRSVWAAMVAASQGGE